MNEMVVENGMPSAVVFKDPAPLLEDFIPPRIKHRDKQIANINYYLSGLIRYGILMNNIIVYGPPGTGKTHSVKSVFAKLSPNLNTLYGRAYRSTSTHAFFRRFLEGNLNLSLHPRESISVYFSAFENALRNMKRILLVFDDVQHLLDEDPKGLDGLLFYLSRLENNLGIILIGNIRVNDLALVLEPPTASSLKLRSVYFPKYNAKELQDILRDRARSALIDSALESSMPAIAKIAAITAQSWGSARHALDLFKEAAVVSESALGKNYIPLEAVEKAEELLEVSNLEDQIRNLPPQALAVLEGIYRQKNKSELYTGDVYSAYKSICNERRLDLFSLRKISDIITELDSDGLINCRVVSRGRFGRTRIVNWMSNSALEIVYEREREQH